MKTKQRKVTKEQLRMAASCLYCNQGKHDKCDGWPVPFCQCWRHFHDDPSTWDSASAGSEDVA